MTSNPRHYLPFGPLPESQRIWATASLIGSATPVTDLILTSRIAGNWLSLAKILFQLESRILSLQSATNPDTMIGLLEHGMNFSSFYRNLERVYLLNCSVQHLEIAKKIREQFPQISFVFLITAESPALLKVFQDANFIVREDDSFLTLCTKDETVIKLVYPAAATMSLQWIGYGHTVTSFNEKPSRLLYAGRISASKNIQELLRLYGKAKKKYPDLLPLELVGSIGNVGSHYREIRTNDFEQDLRSFIVNEGLGNSVILHPPKFRDEWKKFIHEKPTLYVSASLNEDENHGFAPREFLSAGHQVLLPDWGGFSDLRFSKNAHLVGLESVGGLWKIKESEFIEAIRKYVSSSSSHEVLPMKPDDQELKKFLRRKTKSHKPLQVSENIQALYVEMKLEEQATLHQTGLYRTSHNSNKVRDLFFGLYGSSTDSNIDQ